MLVTEARARYILALYRAAVADLEGNVTARDAALADLDIARADARAIVTRRHGDLHHPDREQLVLAGQANVTLYQFGYLAQTETLCYWDRERVLLDYFLRGESGPVPSCIM